MKEKIREILVQVYNEALVNSFPAGGHGRAVRVDKALESILALMPKVEPEPTTLTDHCGDTYDLSSRKDVFSYALDTLDAGADDNETFAMARAFSKHWTDIEEQLAAYEKNPMPLPLSPEAEKEAGNADS